jgi:hypothetical protein
MQPVKANCIQIEWFFTGADENIIGVETWPQHINQWLEERKDDVYLYDVVYQQRVKVAGSVGGASVGLVWGPAPNKDERPWK